MKNVGTYGFPTSKDGSEKSTDRIVIQLNNKGEKDLDNFKQFLKKYPDPKKSNFLDIRFETTPDYRNPGHSYTEVHVNSKKLELNNENLPVFSKINNLLKRISKGEEKMPVSGWYLRTAGMDKLSRKLFSFPYSAKLVLLKNSHSPDKVKKAASNASESLVKTLNDFCQSDHKPVFPEVKSVGGFSYTQDSVKIDRLHLELNDEDKAIFKGLLEADSTKFTDEDPNAIMDFNKCISNVLNVDLLNDSDTGETMFALNGEELAINEKTMPVFQRVAQLMAKMSKTKDQMPFPKDYLSSKSLNEISTGLLHWGQLEQLSMMPSQKKENHEIEIDIVKSDNDAKYIAKKVLAHINKQIDSYFE